MRVDEKPKPEEGLELPELGDPQEDMFQGDEASQADLTYASALKDLNSQLRATLPVEHALSLSQR